MNVPVCGIAATEFDVVVLVDVDSLLLPHEVTVLSAMTAPTPSATSCVIVVNLM